jgi:hypothetical protein
MRWLIALGVVIGTAIVASFVSGIVRKQLSKASRSEKVQAIAAPLASVLLAILFGLGIVIALGIGDPASLKPLPKNIVSFIPKLMISVLFMLMGGAVATLVSNAVATSMLKATGRPQPQLARLIRSVVTAIFVLLAIGQLGIDTKIVDQITTGTITALALTFALLGGLGGRHVAADVAAGRYLKRVVRPGDTIESEVVNLQPSGIVKKLHGATVEITISGDEHATLHVPNSLLLSKSIKVTRTEATNDQKS